MSALIGSFMWSESTLAATGAQCQLSVSEASTEGPRATSDECFGGAAPNDVIKEALGQPTTPDDAWDSDAANPRNWSNVRKWRNTAIVSFYTLIAPFGTSLMAPGLPAIAEHYKIKNPSVVALTLTISLLAWAIGPLFIGPLSEMYGRLWILHVANLAYGLFGLAEIFAPNPTALILFRFLGGIGGSAPEAFGGSCISDMFDDKDRGVAMSAFLMGTIVARIIGPVAGGFMVQALGFRCAFIFPTALAGVAAVVAIPFLEETYSPVIKERRLKRMKDREAGGNRSQTADPVTSDIVHILRVNLSRPFLLLTRSLICFSLSLFMALAYGFQYLMFTTFPTLFRNIYGWSPAVSGLAYLGSGIGVLLATVMGTPLMNKIYLLLCLRNGGKGKPEFRIPCVLLGGVFIPMGMFWYGWSAQARIHWIMPIIGSGICSFGMMLIFIPIQLYFVDTFMYTASALAAASVLRSLSGFAFPLIGQRMYAALGAGVGNSLLAAIAIVIGFPFPIWIYYRGEQLRARNPLNR